MKTKPRRNRRVTTAPALSMSAMIDVVFLLLIFFVVTLRPRELLAQLAASRPAPSTAPRQAVVELVRVDIFAAGYLLNGRRASLAQVDTFLARLAAYSPGQRIVVTSTADAPHAALIKILDACAAHGLKDIALFSR